jgi:hypothetical protein
VAGQTKFAPTHEPTARAICSRCANQRAGNKSGERCTDQLAVPVALNRARLFALRVEALVILFL